MPFRRSPKLSYGPTVSCYVANVLLPKKFRQRRRGAHSTAVGYDEAMRSPKVGKQRSASGAFSLSRALPRLRLPASAVTPSGPRPKPKLGKPGPGGSVKGGRNG